MGRFSEQQNKLPAWMKSNLSLGIFTLVLWLVASAFGFYVMLEFQQMILRRYVTYYPESRWGFQIVRQWSTIFFVGFWLAFVILSGEYHYQNLRKDSSWKVFKWSFLVLAMILLIALIL